MNASIPGCVRGLRGLLALSLLAALHPNARGQIFVAHGTVSEYSASGSLINPLLIPDGDEDIALSGSSLFTLDSEGTIGKFTTAGTPINPSLISTPSGDFGFAVSGSRIFVANSVLGTVAEYTTSGATINTSLISGLTGVLDIDVSGSDIFVANNGVVSEYTTSGALVNASLISGIIGTVLVASGSDLFVDNPNGVGEYTTSGATVDASLISTPFSAGDIAVSGSDLLVGDGATGVIAEYSLGGTLLNPSFITGVPEDVGLAVASVPEEPWALSPYLGLATLGFAVTRRKRKLA